MLMEFRDIKVLSGPESSQIDVRAPKKMGNGLSTTHASQQFAIGMCRGLGRAPGLSHATDSREADPRVASIRTGKYRTQS